MAAILLLVALCGGYYFVSVFTPIKYAAAREVGYRFYLRVAHCTVWLAFASSLILFGIIDHIPQSWREAALSMLAHSLSREAYLAFAAIPMSYWIAPLAFASGIAGSHILDGILLRIPNAERRILSKAVASRDFESLVLYALENGKPILLTLETGIVYIGLVRQAPDPSKPREHLRILLMFSGYRDRDTQRAELGADYTEVVRELFEPNGDEKSRLKAKDFEVVIPAARIVSAQIFAPGERRISSSDGD